MELATLGGLFLALTAMVATVFLEGGSLGALWGPPAFVLVVGGTVGATIMSHPTADVARLPRILVRAFVPPRIDPAPVVRALVGLADKARRQGLLALQEDPDSQVHPLVTRGVAMVVDGLPAESIREAMDNEVAVIEERELGRAAMLETAGGYAPTIGIIGTVFGLVNVLSHLSNADGLGHSIAMAFLATLYGIATANLFWLPLGAKVKRQIEAERLLGEMITLGVAALQAGEHPRSLQEKLSVYIPAGGKAKADTEARSAVGREVEAS